MGYYVDLAILVEYGKEIPEQVYKKMVEDSDLIKKVDDGVLYKFHLYKWSGDENPILTWVEAEVGEGVDYVRVGEGLGDVVEADGLLTKYDIYPETRMNWGDLEECREAVKEV